MATLYFLRISTEKTMIINNELRHMEHPFKVTCSTEDTNNDLFNKLVTRVKELFPTSEPALLATQEWIELQHNTVDAELLAQPVVAGWDEYAGEEYYGWFDLSL